MGLMDKLRGELIDIIEWLDDTRDTMVWPAGASATHGGEASTSKNAAPKRRTARSTSDNASIALS